MKSITYTIINLALILSPFYLKGTHIIGGTAAYQIININDEIATL